MRTKVLLSVLVLFSLLVSCNMPAGQTPAGQPPANGPAANQPVSDQPVALDPNAMATAVELTAVARVTEIAGSSTTTSTAIPTATLTATSAIPTQCSPLVTATVNANVRSGPDTAYDIIGALTLGQTATVVGRNDAYSWWYIDYPAAAGGHGWIAGSVVTPSCVPAVVQVVAAPPLPPTATPTLIQLVLPPLELNVLAPDLAVVNMDVPATVFMPLGKADVTVKVKNTGNADAGNFTVQWWAGSAVGCSWPVSGLAPGSAKTLTCTYTFPNIGNYTVKAVVDSGATVNEANESNNVSQESVQVTKIKLIQPIIPIQPIQP
jgi:uncharacterized protein YraI